MSKLFFGIGRGNLFLLLSFVKGVDLRNGILGFIIVGLNVGRF